MHGQKVNHLRRKEAKNPYKKIQDRPFMRNPKYFSYYEQVIQSQTTGRPPDQIEIFWQDGMKKKKIWCWNPNILKIKRIN